MNVWGCVLNEWPNYCPPRNCKFNLADDAPKKDLTLGARIVFVWETRARPSGRLAVAEQLGPPLRQSATIIPRFSVLVLGEDSVTPSRLGMYLHITTGLDVSIAKDVDAAIRASGKHAPTVVICDVDTTTDGGSRMASDVRRHFGTKPLLIA